MKERFSQFTSPIYTSLSVIIMLLIFAACSENNRGKFYNGYEFPDLKLPLTNNDSLAISDLKGKIVLVEFWASWCKPCRVKHPELDKIREEYQNKTMKGGKNGFEIYYVSLDENKNVWLKAMEKDKIAHWSCHVADLVGMRKSTIPTKFNFEQIPTAYLIDENGIIIGVNLSEERLEYELSLRVL